MTEKRSNTTADLGYRPLTEGYQPRHEMPDMIKGYTPSSAPGSQTGVPPSPPTGGSSAAKPAAKQAG
jgi:hypothetical protein